MRLEAEHTLEDRLQLTDPSLTGVDARSIRLKLKLKLKTNLQSAIKLNRIAGYVTVNHCFQKQQ